MYLTFLGATETVTGSKYLLETHSRKILVDCGLFQGYKELRQRNWDPFPINPREIDAVILTHAHLDHSGYLPLLIKLGFRGKIYCSFATRELCSILLPDSGHLQEEEARLANKYGSTKHKPALPLYTKEEAIQALDYFHPVQIGKSYSLGDELTFQLNRSGHIIGATFVTVYHNKLKVVFSGDLGRPHDALMNQPATIQRADYLILESTYGDRLHEKIDPLTQLEELINRTAKRGGTIVIPAFAVGRAQLLLYYVYRLKQSNRIPNIPIFLDSPMAVEATHAFCEYTQGHHFSRKECLEFCGVANYVSTPEESKLIDTYKMPKIIISASGMATGGRVLHHLKVFLPDYRSTVLLTGFQAGGTRGDRLLRGEKELKIFGKYYEVKAEIQCLSNVSAHADAEEILEWLRKFKQEPRKVFITHGEPMSSLALKEKIEQVFHWNCAIPTYLQKEEL